MKTIPYSSLKIQCETEKRRPTYDELLSTNEWFEKRWEIISRDVVCVKCGCAETDTVRDSKGKFHNFHLKEVYGPKLLEKSFGVDKSFGVVINIEPENYNMEFLGKSYWFHIHHKYYMLSKLPWEYENDALVTMCNWCHNEWHLNNEAPIYDSINDELVKCNYTRCDKCNGAGVLPEYKHVQNGICFNCHGYKYIEAIGRYEI
jgi:hypothetical protein